MESTKRFETLLRELKKQEGVFIAGPEFNETHLRVYAHGGRLLDIPTAAEDSLITFDANYLKHCADGDDLAAALSILQTVRPMIKTAVIGEEDAKIRGRRIKTLTLKYTSGEGSLVSSGRRYKVNQAQEAAFTAAFLKNLPALLRTVERRFKANGSNADKERAQETLIAGNHRSFAENGGTVVCDLESSMRRACLLPGSTEGGSARFDLVALKAADAGRKAELTVIEYKCNKQACTGSNGIKKHAADMRALDDPDARESFIKEILRRFKRMCDDRYRLVDALPEGWLHFLEENPGKVSIRYGFLFTKGEGLSGSTVKSICEAELGDACGDFLYQYRDKPEDVDLSAFKPWDQF